ncbi:hypothetical protein QZH41_014763 [Actinostola sp. cb2023]|nr:hypothetical protein QZH41_014763 [Actinostola sp. cb2023]
MKRSQPEPSTSAPPKKQAMTKIIETVSIGPVSTEEEMNTKVLIFQNKKLAERLEILKIDEERLRERLDDVSHKRDSEFEILSEINRHWIQFDEDVSIMQQSYEDGTAEEFGDQSDTALSYLEHLSQLESNQMKEEVTKRAANQNIVFKNCYLSWRKRDVFHQDHPGNP